MILDFKPAEDYGVNTFEPLVDNDEVTESEEIWLMQYPFSRYLEIGGKDLKLKLDEDGKLGGLEDSSGKKLDFVSFASQDVDASVILTNEESEIGVKLSRRVSVVRYPEPKELLKTMKARTQQKLVGAVTNSSGKYTDPTQSSRHKSGQSVRHSASTRSSRQKSVFSSFTNTPNSSKRKHSESSSGKHRSSTSTLSGSSERSGKSKKKKLEE